MRERLDCGGLGGTTGGKVEVLPRWERCVIIASGPSAVDVISQYDGRKPGGWPVIAINNSWRLCPDADILYACDAAWWAHHIEETAGFRGIKASLDPVSQKKWPEIVRIWNRHDTAFQFGMPGEVGAGGNSGFQALNLAVSIGCKEIALVGFDMRIDRGLHWHGKHKQGLNNPSDLTMPNWVANFTNAAPLIARHGVKVWNCSPVSALDCFEKADLCSIVSR